MKARTITAAMILALVVACAHPAPFGPKYGRLQPDPAVEQSFSQGAPNPGMKYYFLSSDVTPYVIMGIDRALVLDTADAWRSFTPEMFRNFPLLIKTTTDRWRTEGYSFRGYRLLDQNGRPVGEWYSLSDTDLRNPVVFSKDESRVVVYPPKFPRLEAGPGADIFDQGK